MGAVVGYFRDNSHEVEIPVVTSSAAKKEKQADVGFEKQEAYYEELRLTDPKRYEEIRLIREQFASKPWIVRTAINVRKWWEDAIHGP